MSEETPEVETPEQEQPVEEEPLYSKVFPTCIKYESSNGQIEEVWVKEANLKFLYDVDEETGERINNSIRILLEVDDVARDLVVQRYARGGLFG